MDIVNSDTTNSAGVIHTVSSDSNNSDSDGFQYESLQDMSIRYNIALIPLSLFFSLIALVGIVGNIAVLVVFSLSPEYKNTNFRVFVVWLAVVDLLTCLSIIPAAIVKHYHHFSFTNPLLCQMKCFFDAFSTNAAASILFIISIDRYRKVCQPLKKQLWPRLTIRILTVFIVIAFIFAVPSPVLYGIRAVNKTNIYNTNTTIYICTAEKKYETSIWRYIYMGAIFLSLSTFSLCFIVMYSLIIRTIMKHLGRRVNVRFDNSGDVDGDNASIDIVTADGQQNVVVTPINEIQGSPSDQRGTLNKKSSDLVETCTMSLNHYLTKTGTKPNVHCSKGQNDSFKNNFRRKHLFPERTRFPYKTLIWLILTLIFILTYFVYAILSFLVPKVYKLSPIKFVAYSLFYRLHFINNAINPIIYAWLDKRFKSSGNRILKQLKTRLLRSCKI